MNNTILKLATFNCRNYKSNKNNVNNLANNNDITFICEHWLLESEQLIIKRNLPHHHVYLHADESVKDRLGRGRPFGGFCWLIKKEFENIKFIMYNKSVSQIIITRKNGNKINIFGVWLPYENNSSENFEMLKNCFSIIEAALDANKNEETFIMGDFNCDLHRGNRFDDVARQFVNENKLVDCVGLFNQNVKFTYKKGEYKASIDHILIYKSFQKNIECCVVGPCDNGSDHNYICLSCNMESNVKEIQNVESKQVYVG